MESIFTDKELKIASEVVKEGLTNAAEALSFFTKTETNLEMDEGFSVKREFNADELTHKDGTVFLLTTKLVGDMSGVSFLIFSEGEVAEFMNAIYKGKTIKPERYDKKAKNLTLEMDNIITAAVMSKFANAFGYKTYGDVPQLEIVDFVEAVKLIEEGSKRNDYFIEFNAKVVSETSNVKADFVWSVGDEFINGVKKLAQ
jgi:chemotaxis protein CheY-P-specific phosphatase CheC